MKTNYIVPEMEKLFIPSMAVCSESQYNSSVEDYTEGNLEW